MSVPLLYGRPVRWACPNCDVTDVTYPLPPGQSQYHACAGLHGLNAPLVPEGTRARVTATEREDYLNGEVQQQGDDGRAYMNVIVTRDDGQDCTVFAPTATARLDLGGS